MATRTSMPDALSRAMAAYDVRGWYGFVQEIHHEGGPKLEQPLVKAAAAVIVRNPYAEEWIDDLSAVTAGSDALGSELGRRAVELLRGRVAESYGKGGIAGLAGEQEHVVACLTSVFGDAFRDEMGGGSAWISSATKTAAAGTSLDLPLAYRNEIWVRSHYDSITIAVPDGPRPDELLICAAVSTGGRVHHRVGGMSVEAAAKAHRE